MLESVWNASTKVLNSHSNYMKDTYSIHNCQHNSFLKATVLVYSNIESLILMIHQLHSATDQTISVSQKKIDEHRAQNGD